MERPAGILYLYGVITYEEFKELLEGEQHITPMGVICVQKKMKVTKESIKEVCNFTEEEMNGKAISDD